MRGFPKHLNTKQDYLHCLAAMPEETKAALRDLLSARFVMGPVRKLAADETAIVAEGQEVREVSLSASGTDADQAAPERWLFGPREDENAWLFRLGFTVEEVENLIKL